MLYKFSTMSPNIQIALSGEFYSYSHVSFGCCLGIGRKIVKNLSVDTQQKTEAFHHHFSDKAMYEIHSHKFKTPGMNIKKIYTGNETVNNTISSVCCSISARNSASCKHAEKLTC